MNNLSVLKPKALIFSFIFTILLIGLYEKKTGNVVNASYHFGKRAGTVYHMSYSGNFLVYFSVFLVGVALYLYRKD